MRQGGLLPVALCGLALLAGCTYPARSADPSQAAREEVKRAYLSYWDAWVKASETSNPDEPSLGRRAASPELDVLRTNLAAARRRNEVTRGTVGHRIEQVELDGDTGRVADCIDLDKWLIYDASTDKQIDQLIDKPSELVVYTLRRRDGIWRVTGSQLVGEC